MPRQIGCVPKSRKGLMKITEIKLYAIRSGNTGERGAQFGESQYWGGGWQTNSLIANPMSLYPQYAQVRTQWMGPGQDPYAIEVLTDEGVEGIVDLVINGRMIYKRVLTWIFNKIVKTLQVIIFIILAFILTGQYLISISGIVLFYFLTDFVTLTLSTDNAIPSQKPDSWDITAIVKAAVPLGIVLVIESFLLYYAGVHFLGISDADSTYTFVFDILMFISLLDVLIVRERGHFWESRPGKFVLISIIGDILVVIAISVMGLPGLAAISISTVLTLLALTIILTFLVNDLIKVWLVKKLWK